ncbi:hypothetical protein R6Q57_004734 [Mikania cordata]
MEDDRRAEDLVGELVHRLCNTPSSSSISNSNPNPSNVRYATRILSSRMTPSISADEAAMAYSIKSQLVKQGKLSDALSFADLYSKFASKIGPGSVKNKWAVLYLLKVISEDRKSSGKIQSDSCFSGGLPTLFEPETNGNLARFTKDSSNFSRLGQSLDHDGNDDTVVTDNVNGLHRSDSTKLQNGGVLLISKDPENLRDMAYREFSLLVNEENNVSEEVLVRDVLYCCQGIDGKYVIFDESIDGYVLPDTIRVSKPARIMIRKLCELGWLFKKVKDYISETMDKFHDEDVGTIAQAFCAALQDELSEYYKLLAVLQSQSMNPIPLVSENASSGNYLSLRRLSVWFAEPMVKMRLMAVLVDSCKDLKGGAMAGAIHIHAQHGDPLLHDFMKRLLRRVCSPLFEMVRSWVLEGELEDIFSEFFVLGESVKAESLWREGYKLHSSMLPSFISRSLARRILRTGKSINFLRVCCGDRSWADAATQAAAATGTTTRRGGLGYGETDALESLVTEAAKRIDKHLMDVVYNQYRFKEHCLAIKRYLLLGQGDFVQYLMDIVGPELSEPANTISSFKLAGLLESAIRSSNAQYDDPDILERLRVKMMPHNKGDRGWDVFSLDYDARIPLNTVFTESIMAMYLKIFNFLWKLRRVEHALIGAWKKMKPNLITSHFFTKLPKTVKFRLILTSRRCQVLWNEMSHFLTNLQYYIMFEVLEVSWANFSNEMEAAKDLDDLLAAHDKYLDSIVEKSLLGERSQALYKSLFLLFDLILRFRSHADRLYEGIYEFQARTMEDKTELPAHSRSKSEDVDSWLSEGRKAITQRADEFLRNMGQDIDAVSKEYSSLFKGFISQLPVQQHIDLKFLMFRLDFSEFYGSMF